MSEVKFEAKPRSEEVVNYDLAKWSQAMIEQCYALWRDDPYAVEVTVGRMKPDGDIMRVGVKDGFFVLQHGDGPLIDLLKEDPQVDPKEEDNDDEDEGWWPDD